MAKPGIRNTSRIRLMREALAVRGRFVTIVGAVGEGRVGVSFRRKCRCLALHINGLSCQAVACEDELVTHVSVLL